jgi:GNAT superfamily N-acetyltransferase
MLEVRPARLDEIGACADLYVQVLGDTFTWLEPGRHRREDFLEAARSEEIYVALEAGRLVGLAALYRPQRFLHSLYVTERGRGVGKALLDYTRAMAGGPLSLKVQAPNLSARDFYAREGYREIDKGQDGDIAWIRLVGR